MTLREIPNFESYLIDTEGNIYSRWVRNIVRNERGQITGTVVVLENELKKLKSFKDKDNYLKINLFDKNKNSYFKFVHRLVLETFVGPCPKGMQCCHNDGNPLDNRLENLRWDTPSNNQLDIFKHKRNNGKLSERQVISIRKLYKTGNYTQKKLAENFNISQKEIGRIINYKRWKHI